MRRVKDELRRVDVRPTKVRGQNFLHDASVLEAIALFGGGKAGDHLVEIGPGLGALTEQLVRISRVSAIEIESNFVAELKAKYPAVTFYEEDVRTFDFSALGADLVVYGNVPYSLSTDIVTRLCEYRTVLRSATLLLQREFAERLGAEPETRAYGSLSVAVQRAANTSLGIVVPGTAFHPRANVESRVIRLDFLATPTVEVRDEAWFTRVVRAAFFQRRKKLSNSLRASTIAPPGTIDDALARAGIDGNRRAETLTIDEFARLSHEIQGWGDPRPHRTPE